MPTYAIGDLQGCYDELQLLLEKIRFDPNQDTLWFTGDLVNRGPKSLECLRFVKGLGQKAITVLGNHDLHLLAVAGAHRQPNAGDTLDTILQAEDCDKLLHWLRQQPLVHYDRQLDFVLVHAGIPAQWDLAKAQRLAAEVEMQLRHSESQLLANLYGNEPSCWIESLTGVARWRCILNYFTRMRFCTSNGCLDLNYKGTLQDAPENLVAWFDMPQQKIQARILFGHWAALEDVVKPPSVFALDSGCVWGRSLTALCLENLQKFSVKSLKKY